MKSNPLSEEELAELRGMYQRSEKIRPLVEAATELINKFGNTDQILFLDAINILPDDYGVADLLAMCRVVEEKRQTPKTLH